MNNAHSLNRHRSATDRARLAPAVAQLVDLVDRIVKESGSAKRFDAAKWTADWVKRPHPALGGRCPVDLLSTAAGRVLVSNLLLQQQASTYA